MAQVETSDIDQQGVRGGVCLLRPGQAQDVVQLDAAVLAQLRTRPNSRSRPPRGCGRHSSASSTSSIQTAQDTGAPERLQGSHFACMRLTTPRPRRSASTAAETGGDDGSNVEVAMMLDVTGSMCRPAHRRASSRPPRTWSTSSSGTIRASTLADRAGAVRRSRERGLLHARSPHGDDGTR